MDVKNYIAIGLVVFIVEGLTFLMIRKKRKSQ